MTQDPQELELKQRLRQVAVPVDLRQQLLQIPDASDTRIEQAPKVLPRSSRRSYWLLATAAGFVGLIGFSTWWYAAIHTPRQLPEIVQQPTSPANSATQSEFATAVDSQLAELDLLKQQMTQLENSLLDLERQEVSLRSDSLAADRRSSVSSSLAQDFMAQTIYCSAETSAFSGIKTPAVKSQLEFVVQHYPQTQSAQQAQALLAQF